MRRRQVVWNNVIAFPDLPADRAWYFPGALRVLNGRIVGQGVGAIRHCEFTTGAFVEPITAWEEPRLLAFDVAEQPAPMFELSPYRNVHPPHLDGFLRSTRGEFRLIVGRWRQRLGRANVVSVSVSAVVLDGVVGPDHSPDS